MRIDRIVIVGTQEGGITRDYSKPGYTVPSGIYAQITVEKNNPVGSAVYLVPVHVVDREDIDAMIKRQGE